jgi:hypothetical protein
LAAAQNASFPTTVMLSDNDDSIEMRQRSIKRQSNDFKIVQILFGAASSAVISSVYSCTGIETLKPPSQSLNLPSDIEISAYNNRRAFPEQVALLNNNRSLAANVSSLCLGQ